MRISDWSSDVCSSDLVAYGGNYYAIVEPQGGYTGLDDMGAARLIELGGRIRQAVREKFEPVHPLDPTIRGVRHRSEERTVGQECVSTGKFRWETYHLKKNT